MLSKLSDHQLLFNLIVQLSGIHSHSGVSMGRSKRADLKESATINIRYLMSRYEEVKCNTFDLIDESQKRHIIRQLVLFSDQTMSVAAAPGWWIAAELFHHMLQWYLDDANSNLEGPLEIEIALSKAICHLWPLPCQEPCFSTEKLSWETRTRELAKSERSFLSSW